MWTSNLSDVSCISHVYFNYVDFIMKTGTQRLDLNTRTNGSQWALLVSIPTAGCSSATLTPYQKHFYWRQKDGLVERNWGPRDLGNFLENWYCISHFAFITSSLPHLRVCFRSLHLSFLWHWLILLCLPKNNSSGVWLADDPTRNQNHAGRICNCFSATADPSVTFCTLVWKAVMSRVYRDACVYTSHITTHTHKLICMEIIYAYLYLEHKPIFLNLHLYF